MGAQETLKQLVRISFKRYGSPQVCVKLTMLRSKLSAKKMVWKEREAMMANE